MLILVFVRVTNLECADRSQGLETVWEPVEANSIKSLRRHMHQGRRHSQGVAEEIVSEGPASPSLPLASKRQKF